MEYIKDVVVGDAPSLASRAKKVGSDYNIAPFPGLSPQPLLLLHDLRRKEAEQCLIRRQLGLC